MQQKEQQCHKCAAQAVVHRDNAGMSVTEVVNMGGILDITTGS